MSQIIQFFFSKSLRALILVHMSLLVVPAYHLSIPFPICLLSPQALIILPLYSRTKLSKLCPAPGPLQVLPLFLARLPTDLSVVTPPCPPRCQHLREASLTVTAPGLYPPIDIMHVFHSTYHKINLCCSQILKNLAPTPIKM